MFNIKNAGIITVLAVQKNWIFAVISQVFVFVLHYVVEDNIEGFTNESW